MKIRRFIPKQKLRTTARRAPQRAMEDFGEEPSMSFGKALIVFVVLHVVAVSGIYIFNSLKARNIEQSSVPAPHAAKSTPAPVDAGAVMPRHEAQDVKPPVKPLPRSTVDSAKPVEATHRKIAEEPVKPSPRETPATAATAQFYTVAKGDNPVTIAKKFHVSYDELLKINKIEDPKKLHIGQKLRIPARSKNK